VLGRRRLVGVQREWENARASSIGGQSTGGGFERRLVAEEGTYSKKTWLQKNRRQRRRSSSEETTGSGGKKNPKIAIFQLSNFKIFQTFSGKSKRNEMAANLSIFLSSVSSCFGPDTHNFQYYYYYYLEASCN